MFLLASCGGGGGSPNPTNPTTPTTPNPTTPTTPSVPAEGTLLRSGCSADYPGVKWFVYADGQGGEYKDRDRQSVGTPSLGKLEGRDPNAVFAGPIGIEVADPGEISARLQDRADTRIAAAASVIVL